MVERDEEAWTAIYNQYQRLVHRWLGSAPGDPNALVNEAFERMWMAIPPERFAGFPTLGKILEYLRRCARCSAIDAQRREERRQVEETALVQIQDLADGETRSPSEQALDAIVSEQIAECAMGRLHTPQERLVFRASFEWNLKPAAIAERWPDAFASARDVSRTKERILRRLRRDTEVRALLGMDD